jgi:hypothetical protein
VLVEFDELMAWPLLIFLTLFLIIPITLVLWMRKEMRESRQRGFEVKPITGESPVLREKEKTHG